MGIRDVARGVRSILPVSSRSFHAFEQHVNQVLDELRQGNAVLESAVSSCVGVEEAVSRLSEEHLYEQERDMMLYWHLLNNVKKGGTSNIDEIKLEFFRSLPRPKGPQGLFQDNLAKLLEEFDSFCRQNGLMYFAGSGTLLGAHLYHDMIPWDDDLDVFVLRSELDRFKDIVAASGRFRITERWDRRCACLQIRFRLADESNPAFVDLFPLDLAICDNCDLAWRRYLELREEFVSNFFSLVNSDSFEGVSWPYVDPLSEHGAMIQALYEDGLDRYGSEIVLVNNVESANTLIRGIENISESHSTGPWPLSDWLPMDHILFRSCNLMVPRAWRTYLERHYGDYYILPKDMHGHEHISHRILDQEDTIRAMRNYLDS